MQIECCYFTGEIGGGNYNVAISLKKGGAPSGDLILFHFKGKRGHQVILVTYILVTLTLL